MSNRSVGWQAALAFAAPIGGTLVLVATSIRTGSSVQGSLMILACLAFIEIFALRAYILHTRVGSLVGRKVRGLWYSRRMSGSGAGLSVGEGFRGEHLARVEVGDNCYFGRGVELFPLLSSAGTWYDPRITIGNNVCIGDYDRFACCNEIVIEDDVLFAAYVHISDHSHRYEDTEARIADQGVVSRGGVRIGRGTWVGIRAEILPGVHVGEHCVIGAGAIVTRDVPDYSVAVGNPARVIRTYDPSSGEWVRPRIA